jgi:hypothetical protein
MCGFERGHLYAPIQPPFYFFFVSILEQQLNRFFDHFFRFFNCPALTGNAELRTGGYEPIVFALDYGSQFRQLHGDNLAKLRCLANELPRQRSAY